MVSLAIADLEFQDTLVSLGTQETVFLVFLDIAARKEVQELLTI